MSAKERDGTNDDDDAGPGEELFEEDYTIEIMKRLEFKDQQEFKEFIIKNTRVLASFLALLDITNPAQAVLVIMFEMLKNKIISRRKFLETMIYLKVQRDKILEDNGIDPAALPENAVIVVKNKDESAKKKSDKYDIMYE